MPDGSTDFEREVIAHLRQNCQFEFEGEHTLTTQELAFYPDALACRLTLKDGTRLKSKKNRRTLSSDAEFRFLYRPHLGEDRLIPLANDRSNVLLANHWFDLKLRDDRERLAYVRFYYSFCRAEGRGQALNIAATIDDLGFAATATPEERAAAVGAIWRHLDERNRATLVVRFEEVGLYQWKRYRAYVPAQFGDTIYDIELKIWERNGHVTYNKSAPIYRSAALEGPTLPRLGKIHLPGYVDRFELLRFCFNKITATLGRVAYAVATLLFVLASVGSILFMLEVINFPVLRTLLGWVLGMPGWEMLLRVMVLYCILYFVLTTTLVMDVDTMRDALHRWVPKIHGTFVDKILYDVSRKQHRAERGPKPSMWKRLLWAGFLLVFWSLYLIAIFTAFNSSLQHQSQPSPDRIFDVALLLFEQASLYVPMVVYYAGWSFLDPEKLILVDKFVLTGFRLLIGLLVIRRIHRFWAVTASPKLRIKADGIEHTSA